MAELLHTRTSTLRVKLPSGLYVPPFQDKIRARKNIIKSVIRILQTKQLELLCVGQQNELLPISANDGDTIISVNIINDPMSCCNISPGMLLKRFKQEIQMNHEHILIDRAEFDGQISYRHIEIYIRSRHAETIMVPAHAMSASAGNFQFSVA